MMLFVSMLSRGWGNTYWVVHMAHLCLNQSSFAFYTFDILLWNLFFTIHQNLSAFPWAYISATYPRFPCCFKGPCNRVLTMEWEQKNETGLPILPHRSLPHVIAPWAIHLLVDPNEAFTTKLCPEDWRSIVSLSDRGERSPPVDQGNSPGNSISQKKKKIMLCLNYYTFWD